MSKSLLGVILVVCAILTGILHCYMIVSSHNNKKNSCPHKKKKSFDELLDKSEDRWYL